MKKLSLLFSMLIIMLLSVSLQQAKAQTIWDGTADASWYDASQMSFDISTPEELAGVAQLVNNGTTDFSGMVINLTSDLWLNAMSDSTNNWIMIGGDQTATSEMGSSSNRKDFKGTLHGHGHVIYNLYCDRGTYFQAGLFGSITGATIDSLGFINPTLKAKGMIGAVAGAAATGGNITLNSIMVVNARIIGGSGNNIGCFVGASYNMGSYSLNATNCGATGYVSGNYPGGFGGNCEHSSYTNAYFNGTINPTNSNHGGLSAWLGTFSNAYSNRNVSPTGSNGTYKTDTEMQDPSFVTTLGAGFMEDCAINNGYPILSWMICGVPVNGNLDICYGESTTLEAYGYDSYVWSTGATTAAITVNPTTTTDYYVTGTKNNGTVVTDTITVTVYPQAVITATAVASADGQVHGSVTLSSSTVPCGSTQTVTMTITPDQYWHVSKIVQDGVVLREDDPTDGAVVTYVIDPQGTLANVKVYFDNKYDITVTQQLNDGSALNNSSLVNPWGTDGVYSATAGTDVTYTFTGTSRYHITDVMIDGASYGVINTYTFNTVDQTHDILITYADSCGIFNLPYADNLDSYASGSGQFPECWNRMSTYSSTYPYVYAYGSYSSPNALYFYTSGTTYSIAVMPMIMDENIAMNSLMVAFKGKVSSLSNYLQVGVMTNPADANTFVPVANCVPTSTSAWMDQEIFFGDYTGEGRYIAFKLLGTAYSSAYVDDIVVDYAPTCSHVNNLQVSNIFGTNATLTWEPNVMGVADNYIIEVTETATQAITTYTTSETSYVLMGLNELSSYTVTVQADCGGNDISVAETVSFSTPCIAPVETISNSYLTSSMTTEGNHLPTAPHYINSYTEQIYLPSELGNVAAEYSTLSFQYSASTTNTRTFDIYMAHTSDDSFTANTWATPLDNYVHVFSGSVNFNYNGQDRWVDIQLDTNFSYNGVDNLLLIVNDITGTAGSNQSVYTMNASNRGQCEYDNTAGQNWSITNQPTTGRVKSQVPNIRLSACNTVSCIAPNTLSATNVDASSAEINWVNPNATTNCEIEYKAEGETDWTSLANVTTPYVLSGLEANTLYSVRVRALCSTTDMSEWSQQTLTFRTECEAISSLPYTQNFDSDTYGSGNDMYLYCWDKLSNDASVMPYVYAASTAATTPNVLRFRDGAAVTNFAILPRVDASVSVNQLQLNFMVRNTATADPVVLEVGVMTDKNDPTTFESLAIIPNYWDEDMGMNEIPLSTYTGNGQYIAFKASGGNGSHGIRIDNVVLDYLPTCPHPVDLVVSNITSTSADLAWTETGSASSWNIEYGPEGFTPGNGTVEVATSESYTLTGLNANTLYDVYVQADCGGEYSSAIKATFRTDCGAITSLPYTENFETGLITTSITTTTNQQEYITCWGRLQSDPAHFVYVSNGSTYAHSGSHFLDFHWTPSCYNIAIAPELDESIDMSTLMVKFWASRSGSAGTLEVGIMEDPEVDSTFFSIATIDLSAAATYAMTEQIVGFSSYTGNGHYVAFRVANAPSSGYYIDDVTIDVAPFCSPVNFVEVSEISGSSAVINWAAGPLGTTTDYTLEYSEAGQDNWTTISGLTETTYLLGSLEPSTYYDVRVMSNCEDGSQGAWVTENFHTTCLVGGDVAIGEGTTTNSYIPSYTYYKYSLTEQIFTSEELGNVNTFTSISFNAATAPVASRNMAIYLMPTNLTSVSSFVNLDATAQKVYDGNVDITTGWFTIPFDSAFHYDGTSNLMLIVDDNTGSYSSTNNYNCHSLTGATSARIYSDGTNYDPYQATSYSATTIAYRNNVIFGGECDTTTNCVAPHMAAGASTNNSLEVTWVPGYQESAWEIEYKTNDETDWTPAGNFTASPAVINGLNPNTTYNIRMRSDCGAGDYSYWTSMNMRTDCDAIAALPYSTNFDDPLEQYGNGNDMFIYCWTPYTTSTNVPVYVYNTTSAYSGSYCLKFNDAAGEYNMAILPELGDAFSMNALQASFMLRNTTTSNTAVFEIGVMTDKNDPTTFVALDTFQVSDWTPIDYPLSSYTGTGKFLAFRVSNGAGSSSFRLDNFVLDYIPSCPRPGYDIVVSGTTDNSATIAWTEMGSATSWEIEYGTPGFTPGTGTLVSATTNPFTITGLNATTEYQVYVRSICSATDFSAWAGPKSFRTDCGAISTLPYFENFDGATIQYNGHNYLECWDAVESDPAHYAYINNGGSSYSHSGSQYLDFHYTPSCYDIAVLPTIDPSININELTIDFWLRQQNNDTPIFELGIMSDRLDMSTFVALDTFDLQTVGSYEHITYNFTNYTGTGRFIAFKVSNGTGASYYVDDLTLDYTPSCPQPQNVMVFGETSSSANISWVEQGAATEWEIEYGVEGFAQGAGTVVTTTTNPYTLNNLSASTHYDVYVRAICSAADSSNWTGPVTFTTTCDSYDLPFSENFDSYDDWFSPDCWKKFESDNITGFAYIYGNNAYSGSKSLKIGTNYGSSYYGWIRLPQLNATSIADLKVTFKAMKVSGSTHPLQVGITSQYSSIDNQVIMASIDTLTSNWTEVTVYLNNYAGTDGFITLGVPSGYSESCEFRVDDVVVDYGTPVVVEPCDAPTGLVVNNVAQNTATATWTPGGSETTWKLQYKSMSELTWTEVEVNNTPSYNFTNLTPSTQYFVMVKAVCDAGNTSDFTLPISFTTLEEGVETCPAPTDLAATDVQNHAITLTWNQEANTANNWTVKYKVAGSNTWSTAAAAAVPFTLTDLNGNSDYQIQVVANCTNGLTSDPSNTITVHTTNVGINDYDINSVNVYPNPTAGQYTITDAQSVINRVEVYDVYGKMLNIVEVNDTQVTMNASNYAAGTYFVRVYTENGMVTKRIVKR